MSESFKGPRDPTLLSLWFGCTLPLALCVLRDLNHSQFSALPRLKGFA